MGKCPYCKKEVHLKDFFQNIETGTFKYPSYDFSGEEFSPGLTEKQFKNKRIFLIKMFTCPHCDTILGFSNK